MMIFYAALAEWFRYPRSRREDEGLRHRHHLHVRYVEPDGEAIL